MPAPHPKKALRAVLPLLLAALLHAQAPPPTPVRVGEARLENVQDRRSVTGEVRPARRSVVATREAGLVAEVLVREGMHVEAGAPLARLDAVRLERERAILDARRALAETLVREREASLERARRDLAVLEDLQARNAVNPKELSDARSETQVVEARLSGARAELGVLEAQRAQLEQRLADTEPRAPFAGVVVARRADSGEWVDVGGPLVELVSSEELEAWLTVPQAWYAALLALEEPLRATSDAGSLEVELAQWRLVPAIDPNGRTFPVVAQVPDGSRLAPGMSLRANVPIGVEAERLTVPRDAILRGEVGAFVYAVMPGAEGAPASVAPVPVELLFDVGPRSVVRAPRLQPGTRVVVEGNERLYPGASVAPEEGAQR